MSKAKAALIASSISSIIFLVILMVLTRNFQITLFGTIFFFGLTFLTRYLDLKRKEKLEETYNKYSDEDYKDRKFK